MTHPGGNGHDERIYSAHFGPLIHLHPVPEDDSGDSGLEFTCDVGDQETTVRLGLDGIVKLRRYLQRYEAARKRESKS